MAGDPALALAYAGALRRYAADVEAMADAAVFGTSLDHARMSLRATDTAQTAVTPARRAWEVTCPAEYTPTRDEEN
jgi:hypothetical protein